MKLFSKVTTAKPLRLRASSRTAATDMTPMVDVTFLLLIFFMVTASFTLQRAIAMPRQISDFSSHRTADVPLPEEIVSLSVDRFGGFYLVTPLGEEELLGKQSLVSALKMVAKANVQARLEIAVDPDARLQSMVDAIDAGTIAGFAKLTIRQINGEGQAGS